MKSGFVAGGVHILVYLFFFIILLRECRSVFVAGTASAASFFISFAWPSTIATPNYKSLSSDGLLLFLCLFYATERWRFSSASLARCGAGAALLIAIVCYPPLILIGLLTALFEVIEFYRARGVSRREVFRYLGTTATALVFGLLLLGYLWRDGGVSRWLDRVSMAGNLSLTSIRGHGAAFYGGLFSDIVTKTTGFRQYVIGAFVLGLGAILAPARVFNKTRIAVLLIVQVYSIFLIIAHYRGDSYVQHFFFPTAYCLVSLGLAMVFVIDQWRTAEERNDAARFCLFLALAGTMVYCTSTFFFDYYYSWNSGLLGLPFAFSFITAVNLGRAAASLKTWLIMAGLSLCLLTLVAARYNYEGVRRDAEPARLTARFVIPPLRGIRSSPQRVEAVETLYAYLRPLLMRDNRLLIFDDAPMLYWILNAKPAYGLSWAANGNLSDATRSRLLTEFLEGPPPRYAIRTLASMKDPDWLQAPRNPYPADYRLNNCVDSLYRVDRVIYPFEILILRRDDR